MFSQPLEVSIKKRRLHYGPPWRILFNLIRGMVAAALVAFLSGGIRHAKRARAKRARAKRARAKGSTRKGSTRKESVPVDPQGSSGGACGPQISVDQNTMVPWALGPRLSSPHGPGPMVPLGHEIKEYSVRRRHVRPQSICFFCRF